MSYWLEQAERHVLGAILGHSETQSGRVWDVVADRLSADDFVSPLRGEVYGAFALMAEEGEAISLPTLLRAVSPAGRGADRLHAVKVEIGECVDFTFPRPAAKTLVSWVKQIRQAARLRRARALGQEIVQATADGDVEQIVGNAFEALARLEAETWDEPDEDTGARLDEAAKALLEAGQSQDGILRTGLVDVDAKFTAGLGPRTLTVLAALTSRGKTSLAMQFGDELAARLVERSERGVVRVFSLEMGDLELHKRRLIALSGVPLDTWEGRLGTASEREHDRLALALAQLKKRPLRIMYGGGISIEQIRAVSRRDAAKTGLALVIVDYLQALEVSSKDENREREVARMARGLKSLAMDLDVPVLALAQLNRAADQAERPTLSHLRESGAIEQYADNVLFLYQRTDGQIMFKVAKQRNGARDVGCPVRFDGALYTFQNAAKEDSQDDGEGSGDSHPRYRQGGARGARGR